MAGWDAGSIESSLHVDTSPFHHGLEKAKAEAREFADKRYTATVDINTKRSQDELSAVETRLHSIESSLDRIGTKTGGAGGGGRGFGNGPGNGHGGIFSRLPTPGLLGLSLAAAVPLSVPFAGAAAGLAGGALSAGVAGGLGLGAFGLGAKANLSTITTDITKLNKLTGQYNAATTDKQRAAVLVKEQALWKSLDPAQRAAVKNVQHLDSAWESYKKKLEPQTFAVVADGAKIAQTGLKYLLPTAQAVGDEIDILAKRAEHAFKAPFWHQFFGSFLPGEAARSVSTLGTVLGNVGTGVGHLVQDFAPLAHLLEGGSESLSARFEKWTEGSGPGKFVAWVEKEGPPAGKALEGIAKGMTGLAKGFAPIGQVELKALTPIMEFIGKLGDENPGVITAVAGALLGVGAALKVIAGVRGIQGILGGIGGMGRGGGLGGAGGVISKAAPIPVYVTNWAAGGLPGGGGGVASDIEHGVEGAAAQSTLARVAARVGLAGSRRLLGPAALVYATATRDSAPPIPLSARHNVYAGLQYINDPAGKRDFPRSIYPNNKLDVSAATTYLATTGSATQVAQLHDLAKTYPQIATALRGVKEASDRAGDSLDREKSSVAQLRAQFATLGPQVMASLGALTRLPGFLHDAEAAALNGGFVIGKNLRKGITLGLHTGSDTINLTTVTQTVNGRTHVSTIKAQLGLGGGDVTVPPGARRALGGPVVAGRLYQVNEQGVELFRPSVNGTIVPHNQARSLLQQSAGPTRLSPHDISQLAREIGREIARNLPGVNQAAVDRALGIAVMSA